MLAFTLLDLSGFLGPAILLVAIVIAAWSYTKKQTTEASIATTGLLKEELAVMHTRCDRYLGELTAANTLVAELQAKTSLEPIMAKLGELMSGLTTATHEMVSEIREATAQGTARHEAVMREIEVHNRHAQDRHEAMMLPLEKMAANFNGES